MRRPKVLPAQSQIQGQATGYAVIVLHKESEFVRPIAAVEVRRLPGRRIDSRRHFVRATILSTTIVIVKYVTESQVGYRVFHTPWQDAAVLVVEEGRPVTRPAVFASHLEAVLALHEREGVQILELVFRKELRQTRVITKVYPHTVDRVVRRRAQGLRIDREVNAMPQETGLEGIENGRCKRVVPSGHPVLPASVLRVQWTDQVVSASVGVGIYGLLKGEYGADRVLIAETVIYFQAKSLFVLRLRI